jgi:GTP pyrophosphokinase
VPLNYQLHNGQRVEIIAAKQGGPSRDWLNPVQGYLQSPRARTKARQWFKYQNFEENVSRGRAHLDRELHRLRMGSVNQEKLAQKFGYNRPEDFLAVIGRGDIGNRQLTAAIRDEVAPPQPEEAAQPLAVRPAAAEQAPGGILVEGVGNLLTVVAKCCKPVPPDPIVGYVTRGRGVTIHRRDCRGITRIAEQRGERLIAASWGGKTESTFAVDIAVEAYDRQGLLRDISDVLTRERINVTRVDTLSKDNQARMQFTVEITGLDQLGRLLALIHHVPNVTTVLRQG